MMMNQTLIQSVALPTEPSGTGIPIPCLIHHAVPVKPWKWQVNFCHRGRSWGDLDGVKII